MSRDWVQERLDNWARWATERATKGLGFAKTNALARIGKTPAGVDNVIPVDDLDAQRTDGAVQQLRAGSPHLWLTLMCRYIGNPHAPSNRRRPMSQVEIGSLLNCTDRTVRNRLADAETAVQTHLDRER
jgi:hypothetical protein